MSEKWMWFIGGTAFGYFVWPYLYGTFFAAKSS
jgi:hypothetical protein